jgi:hypothetical protein
VTPFDFGFCFYGACCAVKRRIKELLLDYIFIYNCESQTKLYKKGIKTADAILKKCPNNGETLAMKGLLCNTLNRKEEAYQLVKEGVKNNLRSHVCWHVYG